MAIKFSDIEISEKLEDLLRKNGISEPTPVQEQAIPEILAGKDIMAQAQTGTGKTLAFLLPMMERMDSAESFVQALIITPTRELAIQITSEAGKLAPAKGINILAAYGGQDVEQQIRKLKGSIHMIIGTPGRLLDHLRRKTIDLSRLKMLVLDEADQMLDMGFLTDIENIIRQVPKGHQTMLFSATMPGGIRSLAARYMRQPSQIRIKGKNITLEGIRQVVIETTDRAKQDALCKSIEEHRPFLAIIFCRTKRRASTLNQALQRRGYKSDELHGDLTQAKREKVMRSFREAKIQLLVATDVAARGLDIEGVTHVFNYDIPQDTESYIHRIGRTGRAGQAGVAVTFAAAKDRSFLNSIEKGINAALEKKKYIREGKPEDADPFEAGGAERRQERHKFRQADRRGYGTVTKEGKPGMGRAKKRGGSSRGEKAVKRGRNGTSRLRVQR